MPALAALFRRAIVNHPAFAVVLGVGVVVRLFALIVYQPAAVTVIDSLAFLDMAHGELFSDQTRAPGYPAFLRLISFVADDVTWTIALQHVIGLATGVLIYAATLRVGAPRWAAVVPGAAVVLGGDQIFLEHALLTETLFTFLLIASLYCAVRALDSPRPLRWRLDSRLVWLGLTGALLGVSSWVRPVTAPLLLPFGLWCLFVLAGWSPRRRAVGAVTLVAAGALALALLAGVRAGYTGHLGVTGGTGWGLYSRTAQFADCREFTPPAGTRSLCETTPPEERPGPDFYAWEAGSPAVKLFGRVPNGNDKLGAYARAAIRGQPVAYAKTVATDFMRYFAPGFGIARPWSGPGYDVTDFRRRSAAEVETSITDRISSYYEDERPRLRGGIEELHNYQELFRFGPTLLLLSVIFTLAGAVVARGRLRAGIVLFGGTGLLLLLIPVATALYNARYSVPEVGPLAAAGILGVVALVRLAGRRTPPAVPVAGGDRRSAEAAERATMVPV